MALEKKDVRLKLPPDLHEALTALAEVDGCDIGEFAERELSLLIRKRVHEARLIADKTSRLGIVGNRRENKEGRTK